MKKITRLPALLGISAAICSSPVMAETITATDLLNILVSEGLISEEKAMTLVEKVREREKKSKAIKSETDSSEGPSYVSVPYVPEHVKQEIKSSVEQDLRAKVTEDVVAVAKTERWGIPDALPAWTNRFSFSGDARLRYESNLFDENNPTIAIPNIVAINKAGGTRAAGRDAYHNVEDERHRMRGRFRLNVKAKVTQGVDVGLRLVTGNENNPVSTNETFSNYGAKWDTNFDRAYIKYTNVTKSLNLVGGRFKNPFFHSDLVWDSDLNFEGLSAKWSFLRGDDLDDDFRQLDPFITIGAFPLKENHQLILDGEDDSSNDDVWLYAAQLGTTYDWWDQSKLTAGLSYYYYDNIIGRDNPFERDIYDNTAPPYLQYGNTWQNIASSDDPNEELLALASNFELINFTISYDYAGLSPYHIIVDADYVKNMAFDAEEVAGRIDPDAEVPDRDTGYQFGVTFGWPKLDVRGNWKVGVKYRHLEGDAVLDAFADSDFLLGGTNAEGYILRGDYAINDNVWITARWLSAEEIDADVEDSVAVDTFQLDLNTRF